MSTMASSLALDARIIANASAEEVAQFKVLWNESLKLRNQGKIVYFLPRGMGTGMGAVNLRDVAARLRDLLKTPVHVHFDVEKSAYRVGQVFEADNDTVHGCIFVFTAEYPPTLGANTSHFDLAPTYRSAPNSATASDSNLSFSEQKVEKVPKPRNMWIIYRQDNHSAVLARNPGMHTSKISTVIAKMWKDESEEVKDSYKQMAIQEKAKHQLQHPTYKCSPRKSSEIKKRKRPTKVSLAVIEEAPATKAPRLAENVTQYFQKPNQSSCVDGCARLPVHCNTTTFKTGGSQLSSSPSLQATSPAINWQTFGLFQDMEQAFEQPPNDLFVDDDLFQDIDWDANGDALNWLS